MTRIAGLLLVMCALATSSVAFGQQAPAPPPTSEVGAPTNTAEADVSHPAWNLYHKAFYAAVRGDFPAARVLLETLRKDHPGHPASRRAKRLVEAMDATDGRRSVARMIDDRKTTPGARAEFVSFQTAHGIGVGVEFCVIAECGDGRAIAASLIVGGGLGLGASLLASSGGFTPGRTLAINTGTTWGFWNGLAIGGMAQVEDSKGLVGLMLTGQALGLGAGALLDHLVEPSPGQTSMASTIGFWSAIMTTFVHGMNEFDASGALAWGSILLASDLGFGIGASLAPRTVSRSRMLVIDSGGVVGTLVGIGVPLIVQGDSASATAVFGGGILGALGGLGLTTYLTRNWDAPKGAPNLNVAIIPAEGGGLVTLGARF